MQRRRLLHVSLFPLCLGLAFFAASLTPSLIPRGWLVQGVLGGLVCPASGLLMVALMQPVLPLPANQQAWLWLFAALPPAVLNFLVAEQYRQEPSRVASLVLIGNLMSLLVLPPVLYGLLS